MSVENVFAAMLCLMSSCDYNSNTVQINSVNSKPIEVWGTSCRNEALTLNEKISDLIDRQQKSDAFLKTLEESLSSLKSFVDISSDVLKKRSKREAVDTLDILTHPEFDCRSSVNGMKISNAERIPITIHCESNQYGAGWTLIATLDADHRKYINEKSTNEFFNGFGGFLYGEKVIEYFIGVQRLHEMTAKSGEHELLILLQDVDSWGQTHTQYMRYKTFSVADANNDYRLQTLGGYDGSIMDPLQALLGEPFTIIMLGMERTGTLTMFARSVSL